MTPSSKQIIAEAHTRFNQLEDYGFDWSSFYNGYLEGRVAGLPALRLLLEEKDWDDSVQELIEDGAMDIGLTETDENGNYKLTQAN